MPESRAAWAMEGEKAMTGRAACWRKVRSELSFSPPVTLISDRFSADTGLPERSSSWPEQLMGSGNIGGGG